MSMELTWGNGTTTAILDLKSGRIHMYTGSDEFHAQFGGARLSRSRSGRSGKGWIPSRPWLKTVGTYRTDVTTGNMFHQGEKQGSVGDVVVIAPFDYSDRDFRSPEFPVVVIKDGVTYLVQEHDVVKVLSGEFEDGTSRTVGFPIVACAEAELVTHKFDAIIGKGVKNIRRVMEGLHYEELRWKASSPETAFRWNEPFWGRLGLIQYSDRVVKMYCGIGRGVYNLSDLGTVEALQAVAPANVTILTPTLYIQEDRPSYIAVKKITYQGETADIEMRLTVAEGVMAIRGEFADIERRMQEREKEWLEPRTDAPVPTQPSNIVS
ncbi:MAG: hypothetical protein K2X93_25910 [Candidatus Obscuribacterales bacterium]|nr:hypothetical protein [Candidatus Obscuribacterales bacterium]